MISSAEREENRATNLAVLQKFFDAEMRYIGAGGSGEGADFRELASCFHPEAIMRHGPSSPFPGDWKGLDEIQRLFDALADTYASGEDLQMAYYFDGTGDVIALSLRILITSRATGAKIQEQLAMFVSFDDSVIREFTTFYLDPLGVRKACGLEASHR